MGVRHLEPFIKNYVPNGYVDISIYDECQQFKKENNGTRPTIVIDFMGLVHALCKNKVEMFCGGRNQFYCWMLEDLLRKLNSVADLVFFKDGPVVHEKFDTWIRRQNDKYNRTIEVMEKIYNRMPLREIATHSWDLPTVHAYLSIFKATARRFGKLIVTVTKECDAEIARFANRNPSVIAVMAGDTDFLIFPGRWRYWSLAELDLQTLTTKEYSKISLRNFLGLNDDQLVVLSTLAGNDIIQYEEVQKFHHDNCGHNAKYKFPWLAEFIKRFLCLDFHGHSIIKEIAKLVFQTDDPEAKNRIEESFTQYNTDFVVPEISDPLMIFCRKNYYDFTYAILNHMTWTLAALYYDFRTTSAPDIFQISNDFFSKQIGIVLKTNEAAPTTTVHHYEIWTKKTHTEPYRKFFVTPSYPKMKLPPLIELLNRKVHPEHDAIRFDLLKWMVDETKLRSHDLTAIPTNYFLDILVLTFLVNHKFIKTDEADLILLTIKHVELNMTLENLDVPSVVNVRAFRISLIFSITYSTVERALEVSGLKSISKLLNFDGVLFHNYYSQFKTTGLDLPNLLADLEQFHVYK